MDFKDRGFRGVRTFWTRSRKVGPWVKSRRSEVGRRLKKEGKRKEEEKSSIKLRREWSWSVIKGEGEPVGDVE